MQEAEQNPQALLIRIPVLRAEDPATLFCSDLNDLLNVPAVDHLDHRRGAL
jgi:hypothetical protein